MKKITTIFAVALLAFMQNVNAESFGRTYGSSIQSSNLPLTVGVGYAMLHEALSGNGITLSANANGAYLGGSYALPLAGNIGLEPGATIFLATKSETEGGATSSITLIDLAIPINFSYGLDLGGASLTLLAGPTLNLGLLANNKYTAGGVSATTSDYEGTSPRKRFNLYIGAGARLAFGQYGINLSYGLGLLNVYDMSGTDASYKDSRFTVGVSYSF